MKITKLLVLVVSVFATQSAFSATFEVENKSGGDIQVAVKYSPNVPSYESIDTGKSKSYNTGVHSVKQIQWSGNNEAGEKGRFILQSSTGVLLPAARLNYYVNIFPHGDYSHNFAGGHFVRGTAQFIPFVSKKSN